MGTVHLVDFDTAVWLDDPEMSDLSCRPVIDHMAPELTDAGSVDERADLYSFGATLYEMCQGRPPFTGGNRVLRDREAVDVALDLLDALVAFHPDSERLNQLDAKRREGELSEAEFDEWMELKDKGLVHRDIKPLNVILTRKGRNCLTSTSPPGSATR